MAVAQLGPGTRSYTGLHADVKPASDTGATFYETDTGDWFIYTGSAWEAYEYPLVGAGDPASGDLGGTYPNPTVAALHTGATKLTVGAITDGEFLKRSGSTIISAAASGGGSADLGAIAEDVLPDADDTYDLGSQAKRWTDVWVSGAVKAFSEDFDASITLVEWDEEAGAIRMGNADGVRLLPVGGNGLLDLGSGSERIGQVHANELTAYGSGGLKLRDAGNALDWQAISRGGPNGLGTLIGAGFEGIHVESLPTTTDPAADGALFTCTAAQLADLLTAGAKYVLLSKGAP